MKLPLALIALLSVALAGCGSNKSKSAANDTANSDSVEVSADGTSASDAVEAPADECVIVNGHQFVDLGLPSGLLWAKTNIGAETEADYGSYFAWGETQTKTCFSKETYKYNWLHEECGQWYDKYNPADEVTTLLKEDDAASVNWGSSCRIPTPADFEELCNYVNCNWDWTSMTASNGSKVNGWKVTSRKNGNWIFFPTAGWRLKNENRYIGETGNYWSSTVEEIDGAYAYELMFSDSHYSCKGNRSRDFGNSIRPVAEPKTAGKTNAAATGNTQDDKIINGHKFIDLALPSGLLWAETNIGAKTAADDGNYFAWGETELDNRASRGWKTYKYGSSDDNMTKYNSTDQKVTLDKEDDAAYVNWGPSCRMPSEADFAEILLNPTNCECTWTSMTSSNGSIVKGYKITSVRNGKSIFLPASGWLDEGNVYCRGTDGEYWACTLNSESSAGAYSLTFSQHRDNLAGLYRFRGCTIRPVAEP